LHPCSGTGQQYYQITKYPALTDTSGFTVIYSAPHDDNCWYVASNKTLSHDGSGVSNSLANMLKYTIAKYNGDPSKVFVPGTSSGAMLTNVMSGSGQGAEGPPHLVVLAALDTRGGKRVLSGRLAGSAKLPI
jgi:acetylxylan esterase